MPKYFGTDGIRGIPFNFPFTEEMLIKIGFAAGKVLKNRKNVVFIARDTRSTGPEILKNLSKGIIAAGINNIYNLDVITTPALSYLISLKKPSFGIMISASHNPAEYNGIKIFNSKGDKISEDVEEEIESIVDSNIDINISSYYFKNVDYSDYYVKYVTKIFNKIDNKKSLLIDCSNGSAYKLAPDIFKKLGFKYKLIGAKPDGKNINTGCGALDTSLLCSKVKDERFFCGISYDGDADRCIICDENGEIIDGDDIIALAATYHRQKINKKNNIVVTKMSNYGLLKYLKDMKFNVLTVDVGDRNVVESVKKSNALVGGETSGHIIFPQYLCTGDGIITSLEFLRMCGELGIKVSDVRKIWKRFPSVLKSFRISDKYPLEKLTELVSFIKREEKIIEGNRDKKYLQNLCNKVYEIYQKEISLI